VKIPIKNLLFYPGKGHIVAFSTLNIGRYKLAGACVGAAKLALKDSINYAKTRNQFGKSLSNFGLIKEKIAEMAIRIFVGESMVYRTAKLIEDVLKVIPMNSNESCFSFARGIEEFAQNVQLLCMSEMLITLWMKRSKSMR
jgi:alkylation response protein AidB-like acyl-CoA dehydrogenase